MKNIFWFLICAFSIACSNQKSENRNQTVPEIELPFYTESTFTPKWIEEGDEGELSDDSDDIGFGLGAKPAAKTNTTSTFGTHHFYL